MTLSISGGLSFSGKLVVADGDPAEVSITPANITQDEGDSGTTNYNYTLSRIANPLLSNTNLEGSILYSVAGSGANPADAADFVGGVFPSGTITFAKGEETKPLVIPVQGDTDEEEDEEFTITLTPVKNVTISPTNGSATGTITNDDGPDWSLATEQIKIQAPGGDTNANDNFGEYVDIDLDGDSVIVSAPSDDGFGINDGAGYFFTRSGATWTYRQKFGSSDNESGHNFATTLSMSDDSLISVYGSQVDSGTDGCYVFSRSGNTLSEETKIPEPSVQVNRFAISVDVARSTKDTIIAGASKDYEGGNGTFSDPNGAAYVYTGSGASWTQQQKLVALTPEADSEFGHKVALSSDGDTAIVGAYREDNGGSNRGAAYVFTRSGVTWTQQQRLTGSTATANNSQFGNSIALSADGNTAIVGTGSGVGAAYVFTRSGSVWTEEQVLIPSNGGATSGWDVDITDDGNTVIVGSTFSPNTGAAFVFVKSGGTWTEVNELTASDAESSDRFGRAVAISGDGAYAVIGAPGEDTGDSSAGAAYIFIAG